VRQIAIVATEPDDSGERNRALAPVVVDLGRAKPKQIKALRNGEGKLTAKVMALIDELKAQGTVDPSAQPILVIVEKKRRAHPLLDMLR
jgi:Family of unknown function (DUF6200)